MRFGRAGRVAAGWLDGHEQGQGLDGQWLQAGHDLLPGEVLAVAVRVPATQTTRTCAADSTRVRMRMRTCARARARVESFSQRVLRCCEYGTNGRWLS